MSMSEQKNTLGDVPAIVAFVSFVIVAGALAAGTTWLFGLTLANALIVFAGVLVLTITGVLLDTSRTPANSRPR